MCSIIYIELLGPTWSNTNCNTDMLRIHTYYLHSHTFSVLTYGYASISALTGTCLQSIASWSIKVVWRSYEGEASAGWLKVSWSFFPNLWLHGCWSMQAVPQRPPPDVVMSIGSGKLEAIQAPLSGIAFLLAGGWNVVFLGVSFGGHFGYQRFVAFSRSFVGWIHGIPWNPYRCRFRSNIAKTWRVVRQFGDLSGKPGKASSMMSSQGWGWEHSASRCNWLGVTPATVSKLIPSKSVSDMVFCFSASECLRAQQCSTYGLREIALLLALVLFWGRSSGSSNIVPLQNQNQNEFKAFGACCIDSRVKH